MTDHAPRFHNHDRRYDPRYVKRTDPAYGDGSVLYVERFRRSGEGSDITNALTRLLDELPGDVNSGGSEVVFPYGEWNIDTTIAWPVPGVHVRSSGPYTTTLVPSANVTGSLFEFSWASNIYRGPRVTDLNIDMSASEAVAILLESIYDCAVLDNLHIYGVNGAGGGIKVTRGSGVVMDVSQGLVALNTNVLCEAGFTGKAWDFFRLNEAVLINCKGIAGGEGFGTSFHADSCKGLVYHGCSAASSSIGWRLLATDYSSIGITIDTPTVELVTTTIDADGNSGSGERINRLAVRNVRPESTAGPINLDWTILCDIDAGSLTVNEASSCIQSHIFTDYIPNVTSAGANSTVISWANGVNVYPIISPGLEVWNGNVVLSGTWNTAHLVMAGWHFWMGSDGTFRKKAGAPTSDLDGALV